jgi:hypothetical protein
MAAIHADTALESFYEIEHRFGDVLRAVPFDAAHSKVYSPLLASLLLDACSLTESILKSSMDHARYNGVHNIAQHRTRRYATAPPHLNANDLRSVFRSDQFYAKRVWFLPRADPSFPWYAWRKANGTPKWWTAYNRVKHNRLGNASSATFHQTGHALQGTFLALIQCLDFRDRLVERGVIRSRGLNVVALRPIATAWEPLLTPGAVVAASRLFGYRFTSTGFPAQAIDAHDFL